VNYQKQAALVARLYDKTRAGKLEWEVAAQHDTFQVSFPHYSVLIFPQPNRESGEPDIIIQLLNEQGEIADSFSDMDLRGVPGVPDGDSWFPVMQSMHAMARRCALGADKALDAVLKELEED